MHGLEHVFASNEQPQGGAFKLFISCPQQHKNMAAEFKVRSNSILGKCALISSGNDKTIKTTGGFFKVSS